MLVLLIFYGKIQIESRTEKQLSSTSYQIPGKDDFLPQQKMLLNYNYFAVSKISLLGT
jgi:hypothetical protein